MNSTLQVRSCVLEKYSKTFLERFKSCCVFLRWLFPDGMREVPTLLGADTSRAQAGVRRGTPARDRRSCQRRLQSQAMLFSFIAHREHVSRGCFWGLYEFFFTVLLCSAVCRFDHRLHPLWIKPDISAECKYVDDAMLCKPKGRTKELAYPACHEVPNPDTPWNQFVRLCFIITGTFCQCWSSGEISSNAPSRSPILLRKMGPPSEFGAYSLVSKQAYVETSSPSPHKLLPFQF